MYILCLDSCFFVFLSTKEKPRPRFCRFVNKLLSCLEYEHFHRLVSAEIGLTHMTTLKDEDLDILDEDIDNDEAKRNSK